MLILSRRVQESIVIGDDITIQILDMRGGEVSLGVTAPRNISVDRLEIAVAKKRNPRKE